jgi:hypothetical protein
MQDVLTLDNPQHINRKRKKMKSQKLKAESLSKATEESQEYKAIEKLMISLTYLAGVIALAVTLIVGGITFGAVSAILGGPVWAGLIAVAVGLSILIGIYIWAQIKRSNP